MYDLVTIGHAARDEFAGDPEWRIGGTAVYAAAAAARFGVFAGVPRVLVAQGYLRTWDADGTVRRRDWDEASEVLPQVSVAVLSEEDLGGDVDTARRWSAVAPVIVTIAERGALILRDG